MATLNHLERTSKLKLYEADLDVREQRERLLYLSPSLCEWIEDELDLEKMDRHKSLCPSEQVEEIFDQFVKGHHMGRGDMQKLKPVYEHVWEFKPLDVRIFGYFYQRDIFIAVCGEMKKNLIPSAKYKSFIKQVLDFRTSIGLDAPEYMEGELHDLVSL